MRVTQTCTICGSISECSCTGSIVRLFELLSAADQRVSTLKQTSAVSKKPPVNVMIDKLTFDLPSPIFEAELKDRLGAAGLSSKLTKLRDRRWYIQVAAATSGIYFRLGSKSSPYTSQLVSRPSAFPSFADYQRQLELLLSQKEIEALRITRLDLAIDYREELSAILRGFDFKRKQAQVSYTDKGGQRTGLCIGRGAEKILIYDKAIESDLPRPLTRIEVQLSGLKLPARDLKSLQTVLLGSTWNPFDLVTLSDVELPDHSATVSSAQQERLSVLAPILNREGLFSARRVFNEQGNFLRDFQPLIRVQPWQEQPSDAFRAHFSTFFSSKERHPYLRAV